MSAALPEFPTRPDEVPATAALTRLVEQYADHQRQVGANWAREGEAATDGMFAHAVAALALAHAVVDRLQAARWATIRDALAADVARAPDVVAACGLTAVEVAAGLRSWADGQVEHGLMAPWQWGIVDLMATSVEEES